MSMLSRLEGFVAIAEHGQLGRAAAALHLTQPSLTSRLQRLEEIARAHDGSIVADSTPEGVTTFTVRLLDGLSPSE